MKRCYREHKHICGNNYINIQIFPVMPTGRGRKGKRKPSREVQARLNEENSKKKLLRLVNTNFEDEDLEVTLTYSADNLCDDEERARKDVQNFFRRLKRKYDNAGAELKYIWIMERGKKSGKIHFHCYVTKGIDRTELEKTWGFGYANTKALVFDDKGLAGLVYYNSKDKPLTYRRWSCSKNLEKPKERKNDSRVSYKRCKELFEERDHAEEFKMLYPEYERNLQEFEISEVRAMKNPINGEYYFSIWLYRKKFKKKVRGRGEEL